MLLLVGLGNPGAKYANHRHNVGFMLADDIARRFNFGPARRRFQSQTMVGRIGGQQVLILKPETYMNNSGHAVGEAARFFKLDPSAVFVAHDELDLPPGKVRVKTGGGHGGHNGLRSIDSQLGKGYTRIRIGIGHPGHKDRVTGHVLSDFSKTDQSWVEPMLDNLTADIGVLLSGDATAYQNRVMRDLPEGARKAAQKVQDFLTGVAEG